jgi:hypothetical protein
VIAFVVVMFERKFFFFFFAVKPRPICQIVALFIYFMRNYIFVALNILPCRRKKQGFSRHWSPFSKVRSVALKDRTVPDISLNLYLILLKSFGNGDLSYLCSEPQSEWSRGSSFSVVTRLEAGRLRNQV